MSQLDTELPVDFDVASSRLCDPLEYSAEGCRVKWTKLLQNERTNQAGQAS